MLINQEKLKIHSLSAKKNLKYEIYCDLKYNSEKTFISGSGNWEFWGKKKTSFWRPDLCLHKYVLKKTYSFSGLNKFLRIMKTKINQQKMHKLILDNLLLINHSNMFRPLSRSHHQGVRNSWKLQSHCIVLLECCYVYVFALRCDSCGMLSIPQLSYCDVNTYT